MRNLEHPGQILTPAAWREKRAHDAAGGTPTEPTTLYLMPDGTTLGPALLIDPWPADAPASLEKPRMARAEIRGDRSHREGCASGTYRKWERDSCGTCALLGWGEHDEHSGNPAPNYAGWARTYVQAGEPIPRAWLPAFVAELNDAENESYREALRRDVATYGWRITDEKPGYRLPVPTGGTMLAWLRDYHGPHDGAAIREAINDIIENADADYPAGPYSANDVRAARAALKLIGADNA